MRRRRVKLPYDIPSLKEEVESWHQLQEESLEEIVRSAVVYHEELGRDDVGHRGPPREGQRPLKALGPRLQQRSRHARQRPGAVGQDR
jgi:hypothetical protein